MSILNISIKHNYQLRKIFRGNINEAISLAEIDIKFISIFKIFEQIAPLEMYDRVLNTSLKWLVLNHLSVILHGYKYLQ